MNNNYQKYIILSTPRSGSQHLVYSLHSHPNIISYSEPFQPYFKLGNPEITLFENPLVFPVYKKLRSKFPIFFMNHMIFKKYPEHIAAVGFKIFYEQGQRGYSQSVWAYLKQLPNLHVIHLKRKNLLKSLVSYEIGDITNEYMRFDSTPSTQIHITLTPERCRSYFELIERNRKEFDAYFSNLPILQVSYERFIQDSKGESVKIQKFLGVKVHTLSSPLKKQNTRHLSDTIINYQSLRKYFIGTRWARFFNQT